MVDLNRNQAGCESTGSCRDNSSQSESAEYSGANLREQGACCETDT
jgi:hypothetical protein